MPKEEADLVSDLRYTWRKVRTSRTDTALNPTHPYTLKTHPAINTI